MNVQIQQALGRVKRPAAKIRCYVVAFQCPQCHRNGFLDDFEGETEVECCGRKFTVSLTEGQLPDWAQ